MTLNFPKVISVHERVTLIDGISSEKELKDIYLNPSFKELINALSIDIANAKIEKPHFFLFEVRVTAQEKLEK